MYKFLNIYTWDDPHYTSVDHRRGKGSSACLYSQIAGIDVLGNWSEHTRKVTKGP